MINNFFCAGKVVINFFPFNKIEGGAFRSKADRELRIIFDITSFCFGVYFLFWHVSGFQGI